MSNAAAGKADVEAPMNDLLPFAQKMLREHGEFLPFGGHMKPDGTIVWEGAADGREQPPSVALDHEGGYSAVVVFPYRLQGAGELSIEAPFAMRGEGSIFGAACT